MKAYLKGVWNLHVREDGLIDLHLDLVREKGSVGYDEHGFWVDVPEPYGIDPCTGVNTRVLAEKLRQVRNETE